MKRLLAWSILLAMLLTIPVSAGAECAHKWEILGGEEATCLDDGYTVKRCTKCGETKKETVKATEKHSYVDQYELETPTCSLEGSMRTKCKDCGILGTRILPATDHVWKKISGEEATCMDDGWVTRECVWCGKKETTTIKASGEHDWYDVEELETPTCTQEGSMRTKCRDCGVLSNRVLKKDAHAYAWTIVAEATDNSKGVKEGVCKACGHKITEEFYPDGTLYKGIDAKNAVKLLQEKLIACGYLDDKADGIFGKKTEQAVKDFQTASGIKADGIAWPETLTLLDAAYAKTDGAENGAPEAGDGGIEYTVDDIMLGGGVISTGSVNLRNGPGLDYSVVATVTKDTPLGRVIGSAVDDRGIVWFEVEYKGMQCWASSVYSKLYVGNVDYTMDRLPFPESGLYPSEYYMLDGGMELMNYYMCNFDVVCSALYLDEPSVTEEGLVCTSSWAMNVYGYDYAENFVLMEGSYSVYGAKLGMNIEEVMTLFEAAGLYYKGEQGGEEIREYCFLRSYQPDSIHADENGFDVEILVHANYEGIVYTLFITTLGMK